MSVETPNGIEMDALNRPAMAGSSPLSAVRVAGPDLETRAPAISQSRPSRLVDPAGMDAESLSPGQRDSNAGNERSAKIRHATRHTFGLLLLLVVVFLWVTSNFMTYSIFADGTYSKPYLVTYINTSGFTVYLIPYAVRWMYRKWGSSYYGHGARRVDRASYTAVATSDSNTVEEPEGDGNRKQTTKQRGKLSTWETLRLSTEFCFLWFTANYFGGACFSYTSVSSGTILSSTSSVWTLFLGSLLRVEKFTFRKLIAVIVSLVGIGLISTVDIDTSSGHSSGDASASLNEPQSQTAPSRSKFVQTFGTSIARVILGDTLALLSAFLYALYTVLLKLRISPSLSSASHSDIASRVSMTLFFGFVGLVNAIFLLPGVFILNWLEVEKLVWPPPTSYVSKILLGNVFITIISDVSWAYSMLFTSPVVVTVGLGLTIPLAMTGQVLIYGWGMGPWESVKYLAGAMCVGGGFFGVSLVGFAEEGGGNVQEGVIVKEGDLEGALPRGGGELEATDSARGIRRRGS